MRDRGPGVGALGEFSVTRYPSPTTRPPNGFTLFELMVVLALMSLMFGLVAFRFGAGLASSRLTSSAREFSATIRYARMVAAEQGKSQAVAIDMESRSYVLEGKPVKSLPSGITVKVIDPFSGEISHGKYSIRLDPTGGIEGGNVVFRNDRRSIMVQMDPVMGAVVIKE